MLQLSTDMPCFLTKNMAKENHGNSRSKLPNTHWSFHPLHIYIASSNPKRGFYSQSATKRRQTTLVLAMAKPPKIYATL
jgi:hypothetical protein